MNISYQERAILLKLQYNSYNEYNRDIINYLDKNPNINSDDMTTILKKMGFKVSNGKISW